MQTSNYNEPLNIGDVVKYKKSYYKIIEFILHLDAILIKGIDLDNENEKIFKPLGVSKLIAV